MAGSASSLVNPPGIGGFAQILHLSEILERLHASVNFVGSGAIGWSPIQPDASIIFLDIHLCHGVQNWLPQQFVGEGAFVAVGIQRRDGNIVGLEVIQSG